MTLAKKFNQLTQRERIVVLLSSAFVLVFVLYLLGIEGALQQRARERQAIRQLNQDKLNLTNQITALKVALTKDPNEGIRNTLQQLQEKIALQEQRLGELTVDLVSPAQVLPVLQQLLAKTGKVRLLALTSKPPLPLLQHPERPDLGLFKHGIELHVKGSYFEVYTFIQAIEQLPWRFYWQSLNYKVVQYPNAEVRIELYTLSTSEEYIRV